VRCTETRFIARDRYVVGQDYDVDPERAGKYASYFKPASPEDAERINVAWAARCAEETRLRELRASLTDFDPSLLAAAARLIQAETAKRLAAKEV
jgi:hypothetical protein